MSSKVQSVALRAGLAALAALSCWRVEPATAQSFMDSLFGADRPASSRPAAGYVLSQPSAPPPRALNLFSPDQSYLPDAPTTPLDRTTYRTLCVRMCDGFYFPISYATTGDGLTRDAEKCEAACGGDARLFYHANPSGDVEAMVDLTGRAYTSYPNAFKYRKALVKGCQCHAQPWSETERARHRAYAATMPLEPSGDSPARPRDPGALEVAVPDQVIDATDVLAPPPQIAPRPVTGFGRGEPWSWLPHDAAAGHRRSPYAPPGGR
jgi:hypothetical protein